MSAETGHHSSLNLVSLTKKDEFSRHHETTEAVDQIVGIVKGLCLMFFGSYSERSCTSGKLEMHLNQITIGVTNIDAAISFQEAIGLILIVHTHNVYARFEAPGNHATFSVHLVDEVIPGKTLICFAFEDVDLALNRAVESGEIVDQQARNQSWKWREARIRDPFGNHTSLYAVGKNQRFPPWRRQLES